MARLASRIMTITLEVLQYLLGRLGEYKIGWHMLQFNPKLAARALQSMYVRLQDNADNPAIYI